MNRRRFLRSVSLAVLAAPLLRPFAALAQTGHPKRIGRLSPLSAETDRPNLGAFRSGLRDRGWIEGQHFTIEARFADGRTDRLPQLAGDLVRHGVDLIVTGSNPGARAAQKATATIPIVMVTTGDPVAAGIVTSLSRPGRNVTRVTALAQALNAKRLELIKEAVPGVTRVAVLVNPTSPYTPPFLKERERIVGALGLQVQVLEAGDPAAFEAALAPAASERPGALMIQTDPMFISHRQRIVELVTKSRPARRVWRA